MDEAVGSAEVVDAELAREVASAGTRAGEAELELCRRYAPRVRLYGLRHLRDAAAADDFVQEVLVLMLERLRSGRVREPDRLASFVFGACRLIVRNLRRGRRRRQELLVRFGPVLEPQVQPDALALDHGRLRECLARLAERDRTVLVLTFYAERPSNEIAARLGLSAEAVRTARHRAFGRLRDCVLGAGA